MALASGPVHAASDRAEKAERSEEKAPAEKRAAPKKQSRFDTCKRDARALQGPERARFMTECLHDRI